MADIIVLGVVVGIVGLVIRKLIKSKGDGCAGCPSAKSCESSHLSTGCH